MRKIQRIPKPIDLTEAIQEKLTEEFKKDVKKRVWSKTYIREALLKMSLSKCCYCEASIGPGCKEMHVEHYHPKKEYPDEVVDWENLLPSCPHCNKSKGEHDTYKEPIINPSVEDPRKYLYFRDYRYKSRDLAPDSIGKRTLFVLNLNDTEEIKNTRFIVAERLNTEIENIFELALDNKDILCSNTRIKNRVLNGCKNLLKFCQPSSEYGSFMSTILHNDENFKELCKILKQLGLWNEELEELYNLSNSIKYDSE